ncbi:hypothetical protein BJ085DRAFT_28747 [Dimargaris cristalligena]|uniref:Uncharacterized protein n=1 Tax=Dimargaris cristalligena TaxID=215637 RepID=A0A4P9ZP31_9FUNG|nr:hypothetical protein BJ085DRAFT_28747 [Dimargaris cristalligena]|eukprot:RKP35204.1 hypothetical protein BJ085DRAFT_28747 [Dimargaris cristalligena]
MIHSIFALMALTILKTYAATIPHYLDHGVTASINNDFDNFQWLDAINELDDASLSFESLDTPVGPYCSDEHGNVGFPLDQIPSPGSEFPNHPYCFVQRSEAVTQQPPDPFLAPVDRLPALSAEYSNLEIQESHQTELAYPSTIPPITAGPKSIADLHSTFLSDLKLAIRRIRPQLLHYNDDGLIREAHVICLRLSMYPFAIGTYNQIETLKSNKHPLVAQYAHDLPNPVEPLYSQTRNLAKMMTMFSKMLHKPHLRQVIVLFDWDNITKTVLMHIFTEENGYMCKEMITALQSASFLTRLSPVLPYADFQTIHRDMIEKCHKYKPRNQPTRCRFVENGSQ